MEILIYIYLLVLVLFVALVVPYRIGTSSLRSELRLASPEVESVVFPQNAQPRFSYYSAISLNVLFRPRSVTPSLPPAAMDRLLSLSRTAAAAAIAALLSCALLAALLIQAPGAAP